MENDQKDKQSSEQQTEVNEEERNETNDQNMDASSEEEVHETGDENGAPHDLQKTASEEKEKDEGESRQTGDPEKLQAQLDELKDKYLRLYAEFENYKKRTLKERVELRKTAAGDVMSALLPVLDDFDRAKRSAEDEETDETFSEGVELVYNKLYKSLQEQGLQPMDTDGKDFNPDLHEAVSEIPAPSDDMKGKIIDTVEKGYFLNDRILRHAKVVVGK